MFCNWVVIQIQYTLFGTFIRRLLGWCEETAIVKCLCSFAGRHGHGHDLCCLFHGLEGCIEVDGSVHVNGGKTFFATGNDVHVRVLISMLLLL